MALFVEKFKYPDLSRKTYTNGSRLYNTPTGFLPSVTTILSETSDKTGLKEWENRVGTETANRERKEAADLGTLMHEHLENHIRGIERPSGNNFIRKMAKTMADVIIESGLANMNEVWGMESGLYFPHLYAGTADLIGVHRDKESILDFKSTKKPKKEEWIENYFLQGTAYALAHNELFGTNIQQIVIFMVSREFEYQEFVVSTSKFGKYSKEWVARLNQYDQLQNEAKKVA